MTKKTQPAAELEAEARAINATDWQPPPGMTKRPCSQCRCFFAVLIEEAEATSRCPDCASLGTRHESGRSKFDQTAQKPPCGP